MENAAWTVRSIDASRILLMAIILSMAGCESTPPEPENPPPEAVGTIPDQELFIGEEWSVGLVQYFTDTDDDTLTYAAEALDDSVISVRVQADTLWVEALSQGSTSVTATATDTEGGSARQSFEVTVPNRSPTSTTIPDMMIPVENKDTVDLGRYFGDPDNDELSYSVRSEGNALVVGVEGEDLILHAGPDPALVRVHVVATDEPGDSATESFSVDVFVDRGEGFRDDFDDESSLDDWTAKDLRARIDEDEGLLVLDEEEFPSEFPDNPGVFREVEINRGWKAEFSVGLLGEYPISTVMIITGDDRHRAWSVDYAWYYEEWELLVYDSEEEFWVVIAEGDLTLSEEDQTEWEWVLLESGLMTISVEGDEIYRHTFPAGTPTGMTEVGLGFYFSEEEEEGVLFNYFEINPEG